MAILGNGIETIEFSDTDWVTKVNSNFNLIYSISEMSTIFNSKALATHNHDDLYELSTTTIDQAWLQTPLQALETDIKFTNDTEGVTVIDTSTSDNTRIYIDDGVISTEVVV